MRTCSGGIQIGTCRVPLDIGLDRSDEGRSATHSGPQFVLEYLDEGAIAGQVNGWGRGFATGSINRQVIEESGVGKLETN